MMRRYDPNSLTPIVWPPRVRPPMDDCAMAAPDGFYFPNSPIGWIDIAMREELRRTMFKEQRGRCYWCNEPMDIEARERTTDSGKVKQNDAFASFEHLKRKQHGGGDDRENLVLAHAGCNRKRDSHRHHPRYAHDPHKLEPTDGLEPSYTGTQPAALAAELSRHEGRK